MIYHVVDVVNENIFDAELIVRDGSIAAFIPAAAPAGAPYLLPGFVDSHIHIESTLLLPERFAPMALAQGTLAVAADPHEIANVLGTDGVELMVESAHRSPLHVAFGIPSGVHCVEAFETAGAKIDSQEVARLLPRKEFYGLAEMMNFVGLLAGDPECSAKVRLTLEAGKVVDGHAPGLVGDEARRYVAAGVSTDHEMFDIDHARERLVMGMKILIREGSAARNFDTLAPLLADDRFRDQLMFCTDDIYPDELAEGHINRLAARAVAAGLPLWNVLRAACLNPVRHYGLPLGLLQPGDAADYIVVENLTNFRVLASVRGGREVYGPSCTTASEPAAPPQGWANQFGAQPLGVEQLRVPARKGRVKVIVSQEQQLLTDISLEEPRVEEGFAVSDPQRDMLKVVVLNRYAPAKPTIGFLRGFGLQRGALASSIAHDSHNIIAVGVSDDDICRAINTLVEHKGGLCVAEGARERMLPLPVAGLMSAEAGAAVAEAHRELKEMAAELGCRYHAPFMTLAFMALPVIPKLKITDKTLFDVEAFCPTGLWEN